MIYLKARGYAKSSEFGNPTICGKGKNQIEKTLKTVKTLLEIGESNLNVIHTIEISFDPYELNPNYKPITKTKNKTKTNHDTIKGT